MFIIKNDEKYLKYRAYDESQNIILQMKLNKKQIKEMGENLILQSKV